jgi:hypothetical protein
MYRITRAELLLRLLTAVYIVMAAVAFVLPTRVPDSAIEPGALRTVAAATAPAALHDGSVGDVIVNANIFSFSRKAPARRYDPLTFGTEAEALPQPVAAAPVVSDEDAVPKLYGIVGGPDGAAALLRLDAAIAGALLYRAGEKGGAYRVVEIHEQSVVLSGPSGRITLRLVRQES